MTDRQCPSCGGQIHDGTLCTQCLDRLHDDLATIGDAITELHTQLARQSRTGNDGGTSRAAVRPLPYDTAASEALDLLRSVLVGWTRDTWETHSHNAPRTRQTGPYSHGTPELASEATPATSDAPRPPVTIRGMARYLRWSDWLNHPAADEFADELRHALTEITRCIDTPPQRRYLGPCGATNLEGRVCVGDVIQQWTRTPRCRDCNATHDYDERMAWIMDLAEDQLVTASVAAGALSAWGAHITPDLVRKWAERGRLIAHGHDRSGRPVYQFRQCRVLALDTIRRRSDVNA